MSNIGLDQLTSVNSKIIRKPITLSRKKKKSLQFGHDHETSLEIVLISHTLRICLIKTAYNCA